MSVCTLCILCYPRYVYMLCSVCIGVCMNVVGYVCCVRYARMCVCMLCVVLFECILCELFMLCALSLYAVLVMYVCYVCMYVRV